MTIRMLILSAALAAAASTALTAAAPLQKPAPQQKKDDAKAASVTGKWQMTVKNPHGQTPMVLTLAQDGKKVTGTFNPHGEDIKVEGTFDGQELTLATPGAGESRITFKARLKDDGRLDGYVSSQMGDMPWTAERK
jgi:uncharacterized protein (TIGR03066 family)